jgi:hypothetical protein
MSQLITAVGTCYTILFFNLCIFVLDGSVGVATFVIGLLPTTRSELPLAICLILLGISLLISALFRVAFCHFYGKQPAMRPAIPGILLTQLFTLILLITSSVYVFQKEHEKQYRYTNLIIANYLVYGLRSIMETCSCCCQHNIR